MMFSEYSKGAMKFISQLRYEFPHTHIIAGGAHASTFPEETLEFADSVVVGEGEEVICDIVSDRKKGIFRTERIRDLDKLPMPAWDLMEEDMKEINWLSRKSPFLMRRPLAHIISSRGCPNNCSFCAVKVVWGRQWIARLAKNVVDEIEYLYGKGYREIHFNDDNATVNKVRFHQICEGIIERNLKIKLALPTGVSVKTLDEDLLKHMKQAGFYRLCFGIETGNQDIQYKIHKDIDLEKARKVIKIANRLGYWTSATFILGFDGEDRQDTLDYAKTCGIDFPIFYDLQIQPKTELWTTTKTS
jgi:radical SAM superfamily enzyme YgiQ (UPF0313 family)